MRKAARRGVARPIGILAAGLALLVGCGDDGTLNPVPSTTSSGGGEGGAGTTSGTGGMGTGTGGTGGTGTGGEGGGSCVEPPAGQAAASRVIVFVWDGLRPDSVTLEDTPNLLEMSQAGSTFSDNHSTYPTFTMMNAASFATGCFPDETGFYGNTFWAPGATGNNSGGSAVDFLQPVFVEDYAILEDLDAYYGNQLLLVGTLFKAAQDANLTTATVGKTGAAFLQDYKKGGILLDEKMAYPLSFAEELQAAGVALPKLTTFAYPAGQIVLDPANGDPTAALAKVTLADGVSSDPSDASGNQYTSANSYLMGVYLDHILPEKMPDLSVIWLRNPDSTEHTYGPGTSNYLDALHAQDTLLGALRDRLATLGLDQTTDIIVVSDHGHSTTSGPLDLFPLRGVSGGAVAGVDPAGYAVSGDVRLADLLTRAGFTAFDGAGCTDDPVLSGIKADGSQVYPSQIDDTGTICGTVGKRYSTASFKVPEVLPFDSVIVAANGGSDYLYVLDHDPAQVRAVVSFLQSREEIGAIFVDSQYGEIPGTLALSAIKVENLASRNPDIIVSFNFDETAVVQGMPGIEFESAFNNRGMHGSFSPVDVHNTLIAFGPDFRAGFTDELPTGNVDVAPTIAWLFGLPLPEAEGRPLYEALQNGVAPEQYAESSAVIASDEVSGLVMKLPTSPDGADIDPAVSHYHVHVHTQSVELCGKSSTYFDYGKAVRQ